MLITLSNRLRTLREERGLSQRQLAAKLGVSPSAVNLYENGSRLPSFDILLRLRRVFGVSTDYLLGVDTSRHPMLDALGLTLEQIRAVEEIIHLYQKANQKQAD